MKAKRQWDMPLRLRLAVAYGTLCALMVGLVALLGYGVYVRGQYQTLDQVLLLSANHVEAGWRAAGVSYVLEADISQLQVAFRLYGPDGSLKRSSRQVPPLPLLNPIETLAQPQRNPVARFPDLGLEANLEVPEATAFGLYSHGGQRSRYVLTQLERGQEVLGYLEAITPLSQLDQAVSRLIRILLVLALISVLGVFGLSLGLAQLVLLPVNRLTHTASEIARSRDLSKRVEGGSARDELGLLGSTFNQMLHNLQEATEAQRRFVADASHELRAPLSAIQGNLELLYRYPTMLDAEREETIVKANREVSRLSRLVSDLLTLAKSDADLPLRHVEVELKGMVLEALREARYLLGGQRLEAAPMQAIWVKGDPDHLKQLVLILLDNAIAYTLPEGLVRVELQTQANHALLKVSDTGIGIPAEHMEKVFKRFYRVDQARSRNKGGSGLGLAIAHWIVERHGGNISIESQVGKGTTVSVQLPTLG